MEGIMGLAQGNMNQGPEPIQEPTPQQVQAFEQMRQQVPSREARAAAGGA